MPEAPEQDTRTRTQLLEAVAQGWLLFHSAGWDQEQDEAWRALNLGRECSSKALGDATRRALAMPAPPARSDGPPPRWKR